MKENYWFLTIFSFLQNFLKIIIYMQPIAANFPKIYRPEAEIWTREFGKWGKIPSQIDPRLRMREFFHALNRVHARGTISSSSNNLLLGSSITKSGLHRGPNTRYILYNDTIKIF